MRIITGILSSAILLISFSSAHAGFITTDWLNQGDELLTHDTDTGLYWLDVSYTLTPNATNPSYTSDAINIRTQDSNDVLNGFRHATAFEVEAIFNGFGLNVEEDNNYDAGVNARPTETNNFLSLFGNTRVSGDVTLLNGITATTCAGFDPPRCNTDDNLVIATLGINSSNNRTYANIAYADIGTSYTPAHTGHFLVSDTLPSAVPIPAAVWLFGSALMGLVGVRRKKV